MKKTKPSHAAKWIKSILGAAATVALAGCSVFGRTGVDVAAYETVQTDGNVEVRRYDDLVLVSTPMSDKGSDDSAAFRRLFNYISGENTGGKEIEMTAPVVTGSSVGDGQEIAMTAPVLMNQDEATKVRTMSFVLPDEFTYETAPEPSNRAVTLDRINNWQVAVIRFSGFLNEKNTLKYQQQLEQWIEANGYRITGTIKTAGYNPPWTLPNFRRNEVLIPVEKVS